MVELVTVPTPVSLDAFDAVLSDEQTVNLAWETASEQNNDYFVVEHSVNGQHYEDIGMLEGAGTSLTPKEYAFVHEKVGNGSHYYRLRQVDYDGRMSFSEVKVVEIGGKGGAWTVYPTVTTDRLNLVAPDRKLFGEERLQILSSGGAVLKEVPYSNQLDVADLPQGLYYLMVQG